MRAELKKKTGIVVDQYGKKVVDEGEGGNEQRLKIGNGPNASFEEMMFKKKDPNGQSQGQKPQKKFTPINSYKPQGALIYNEDLLNSLEDKFT